jgi:hypothetical protein
MQMAEVRKRVVYCSYLLAVIAATSCLVGTVYFFSSEPMPYHLAAIGMTFEEIRGVNPNLALFLARTVNTLGVFQIGIGILAVGIALGAFRRAELWAWFTLLPGLSILLGRIMLGTFRIGAPVRWLALTMTLTFLTAMLVPVKDFFGSR